MSVIVEWRWVSVSEIQSNQHSLDNQHSAISNFREAHMAVIRDVMPVFELYQPASVDAALELLDKHGAEAWVLAGGLDSMDWLKDRLKKPKVVVDLTQVTALHGIREANGGLEIGAMTTLTEVVKHPVVREKYSILMEAAELVACECVVEAETKDHLNWELIEVASKALKGDEAQALKDAYQQVEEQEDEHLYHTTGWCRELWIQSLGLPAVIPPPEEEKEVKTAIGAARAKQARREML